MFADILHLVGDCSCVITAGGYRGDDSLTYRRMWPDAWIHCVEPTPAFVTELNALFAHDPRVRIHPYALSDADGVSSFRLTPERSASSLLPIDRRATKMITAEALGPVNVIEVPARTLDTFCHEAAITNIDLLALDVQGAELLVLNGATRLLRDRQIRWLTVEMCFVPVYEGQATVGELASFLDRSGFGLRDFYNFAYSEDGQLLWGDALYRLQSSGTDQTA